MCECLATNITLSGLHQAFRGKRVWHVTQVVYSCLKHGELRSTPDYHSSIETITDSPDPFKFSFGSCRRSAGRSRIHGAHAPLLLLLHLISKQLGVVAISTARLHVTPPRFQSPMKHTSVCGIASHYGRPIHHYRKDWWPFSFASLGNRVAQQFLNRRPQVQRKKLRDCIMVS